MQNLKNNWAATIYVIQREIWVCVHIAQVPGILCLVPGSVAVGRCDTRDISGNPVIVVVADGLVPICGAGTSVVITKMNGDWDQVWFCSQFHRSIQHTFVKLADTYLQWTFLSRLSYNLHWWAVICSFYSFYWKLSRTLFYIHLRQTIVDTRCFPWWPIQSYKSFRGAYSTCCQTRDLL